MWFSSIHCQCCTHLYYVFFKVPNSLAVSGSLLVTGSVMLMYIMLFFKVPDSLAVFGSLLVTASVMLM